MCYANEVVKEMERLMTKARSKRDLLRQQLSEQDKKISQMYHFIEMSKNLSGSRGFTIYRDLREMLRQRRLVKHELSTLEPIFKLKKEATMHNMLQAIGGNIQKQEVSFSDYTKNWGSHEKVNVVNTFDDVFEKEFQRQF